MVVAQAVKEAEITEQDSLLLELIHLRATLSRTKAELHLKSEENSKLLFNHLNLNESCGKKVKELKQHNVELSSVLDHTRKELENMRIKLNDTTKLLEEKNMLLLKFFQSAASSSSAAAREEPLTPEKDVEDMIDYVDKRLKTLWTRNEAVIGTLTSIGRNILIVAGLWYAISAYNTIFQEAPKVGCGSTGITLIAGTVLSGVICSASLIAYAVMGKASMKDGHRAKKGIDEECRDIISLISELEKLMESQHKVGDIRYNCDSERLKRQHCLAEQIIETEILQCATVRCYADWIAFVQTLVIIVYVGAFVFLIGRRICIFSTYCTKFVAGLEQELA